MSPVHRRFLASLNLTVLAIAALALSARVLAGDHRPFLDRFDTVNLIASTVPASGDVNPYGIAVVPRSVGALKRGHILISNFNNGANLQGTGTTIVQVSPGGKRPSLRISTPPPRLASVQAAWVCPPRWWCCVAVG